MLIDWLQKRMIVVFSINRLKMTEKGTDTQYYPGTIYTCEIAPLTLQEKEELKTRISSDIERAKV